MIRIVICEDSEGRCVGFRTIGHAGYADAGQDIVCASVSVLVINTMNSIEKFADDQTSLESDEEQGMIEFRTLGTPSKEATLLLNAMILGLEDMAADEEYHKYMELLFEEV